MTSKREEILDIAENHFREFGYRSVNLRTLARAADIKKASLYYHFPQGKEQLFVEVNLRSFDQHGAKIEEILEQPISFEERVFAVVEWFLDQPGLHLISMMHYDMENLSEENYGILFNALFTKLFLPISRIFERAKEQDIIEIDSPQVVAGAVLAMLDSFSIIPEEDPILKKNSIKEVITIFLNGMKRK